jgi:hypothetical protein
VQEPSAVHFLPYAKQIILFLIIFIRRLMLNQNTVDEKGECPQNYGAHPNPAGDIPMTGISINDLSPLFLSRSTTVISKKALNCTTANREPSPNSATVRSLPLRPFAPQRSLARFASQRRILSGGDIWRHYPPPIGY